MKVKQVRFALGFLLLLGAAVMVWGVFGPIARGAAFADVLVQELNLPRDPATFAKVREILFNSEIRSGVITLILGLLIAVPAALGLFATRGAPDAGA